MDTIPNLNLTTTERIELAAAAAAYKASEAFAASVSASNQEVIERVQKIADMIDAQQRRIASKDKWWLNVLNYAVGEWRKRFDIMVK